MNREDRYHTTSWDAGEVRRQGRPEADRPLSDRLAPDRQAAERPEHSERSQQRPPAQNQVRSQKKRRQKPRTNPLLAFILWVVIVAASSTIFAGVGWLLADDFAALTKAYKEVNFEVSEDWIDHVETNEEGKEVTYYDMKKVAGALEEEGLVKYGWFFRLFCKFYHAERKVTQGTFALNTNMDYMALVRNMRSRGGAAVTVDVAIPEGYTVSQIIDLLVENEVGTKEALTETAGNYDFGDDYPFLNSDLKGNISRLEGYLFPDTYNFYEGGRPELVFNAMLSNFNTKVYGNEDLAPLFAESEYDLDEIITIASLIEKETDGGDRDKISSVIYNRLHNEGETNYLLQIDAALVYAAGRTITQDDYANLDSPYNLYTNQGLPPTPIANPGNASIRAALQPAETDYYFYVLGGDGKHVFSETLAQHNQAVADAQNQKQE